MTTYTILWVDDEPDYIEDRIAYLRKDPELVVEYLPTADEGLRFIQDRTRLLDLLIWDMIMPRGSIGEAASRSGRRTGIALFDRLRELRPTTPAILYTYVTSADLDRYKCDSDLSWYFNKHDFSEELLHRHVRRILGATSLPPAPPKGVTP